MIRPIPPISIYPYLTPTLTLNINHSAPSLDVQDVGHLRPHLVGLHSQVSAVTDLHHLLDPLPDLEGLLRSPVHLAIQLLVRGLLLPQTLALPYVLVSQQPDVRLGHLQLVLQQLQFVLRLGLNCRNALVAGHRPVQLSLQLFLQTDERKEFLFDDLVALPDLSESVLVIAAAALLPSISPLRWSTVSRSFCLCSPPPPAPFSSSPVAASIPPPRPAASRARCAVPRSRVRCSASSR